MSDESRIRDLLEEALNSGRTPEDVCVESPELLWEVRERLKRCMEVEAQIDAIFPSSGIPNQPRRPLHLPTALPQIPGYQVEAILGHGGMGVVYKARHLKLKRSVAIKMVLSGALAAPEEVVGLAREAEAVAGLRHPNIVQVHDVGDFDGLPYFTMEFVEGGSLAQKLNGVPQPSR
jgi:serine/threonine-protein kinase